LTSFFAVSCEASALIFLFEFSFTPLNGLNHKIQSPLKITSVGM
jgi:hypothetical protein